MKKIIVLLAILSLVGCQKKQKPVEEYIPILYDDLTGFTYYIATPSGYVYEKGTDSEIKLFYDVEGKTVNVNNYK